MAPLRLPATPDQLAVVAAAAAHARAGPARNPRDGTAPPPLDRARTRRGMLAG
jgi:hypothetical protein